MNWASRYVGLRYLRRGRDINGIDCWGLVRLIYAKELRLDLPLYGMTDPDDYRGIARDIDAERRTDTWHPIKEPQDFDVVLMTSPIDDDGVVRVRPIHIGIVAGKSILHTEADVDTVCVPVGDPSVAYRIVEFYRHRSRIE